LWDLTQLTGFCDEGDGTIGGQIFDNGQYNLVVRAGCGMSSFKARSTIDEVVRSEDSATAEVIRFEDSATAELICSEDSVTGK
jgi:hypothetical protein